jgi:hypothetical protein
MIMWIQLTALTTAILLQISMQAPLHFLQEEKSLAPDQQQVVQLQPVKYGKMLWVQVDGSGAGDLDCYLLVNHRIVSKDEGIADMCYLGMYVNTDQPIKLWILNNGKHTTKYVMRADQ